MQAVLCHHKFLENILKIFKKLEKENKEETAFLVIKHSVQKEREKEWSGLNITKAY